MRIGGFYIAFREKAWNCPTSASIASLKKICDDVLVIFDPRLDPQMKEIDCRSISIEYDLNEPTMLATLYNLAMNELGDADLVIFLRWFEVITGSRKAIEDAAKSDILDAWMLPTLPLFNGGFVKMSHRLFSLRAIRSGISFGVPNIDKGEDEEGRTVSKSGAEFGCVPLDKSGAPICAGMITPRSQFLRRSLKKDIWILDYYWFSLPNAWEASLMSDFLTNLCRGMIYDAEEYCDKFGLGIFDEPIRRPLASYLSPIKDEMKDENIYSIKIKHPVEVVDWAKRQRVLTKFNKKRLKWREFYAID